MSELQTNSTAIAGSSLPPCCAFFIRRAVSDKTINFIGRKRSGSYSEAGAPAVIMVCGVEWTSRVPRTQTECDQTNAWAAKIISQNTEAAAQPISVERQGAPRSLTSVPVASGAGLGVCGCGWRSRVADDGNPEYGWSEIEADFAKHVCLHNGRVKQRRRRLARNYPENALPPLSASTVC